MSDRSTTPPINTEIPNAARIYDYLLGGTHNFPADQAAAGYMVSLLPSTPKWLRMLRDFLPASARRLHREGLTYFADFASGLPTDNHIHTALPAEARIVYSDNDPYTISQARRLVDDLPNVVYLEGDVAQARALLESAPVREFFGGNRKVALGLSGISVFLAPDELAAITRELYEWAAPGSRLYLTFESKTDDAMTTNLQTFIEMMNQAGGPYRFYSVEECHRALGPWTLNEDGLVPLDRFLGLSSDHLTEEDREGVGLEFYAAIAEKR
jgi:hypothetical protein